MFTPKFDPGSSFRALGCALALAATASADVWIVDAAGNGDFLDLPPAVAAAADGDVLVVRAGTYQGFDLVGKGLSVLAEGAGVQVGPLRVEDVPAGSSVVLADLQIDGVEASDPNLTHGLVLEDVLGTLRVQQCVVTGGFKTTNTRDGGDAALVTGCARVVFAATQLLGGDGQEASSDVHTGGAGGRGLRSVDSRVALHGCTLVGGQGGPGDGGGAGGEGALASGSQQVLVTIGSDFAGGDGGDDLYFLFGPGAGGAGLRVEEQAKGRTRDSGFVGSVGGDGGLGASGPPVSVEPGAQLFHYSGSSRVFAYAGSLRSSAVSGPLPVVVTGEPGDRVWLLHSGLSSWGFVAPLAGVWTLPAPYLRPLVPQAVLPAGGSATLHVDLPPLAPGETDALRYLQGFVLSATGQPFTARPWAVVTTP